MNYRLILFLMLSYNLVLLPYAFAVDDGLMLYLPLDGNVKDLSENGFAAELLGNESWDEGKFGKGMVFDGSTYIQVFDEKDGTLDGTTGLTIGLWVRQEEHHDNGIVVKLTSGSYWPCSYNLETWSDGLAYFDVGSDVGQYATAQYPLKEWYYLVGVFDGEKGEDRIYVNGKLESTNPRSEKTVPDGEQPVFIGCVTAGQLFFRGMLDEVVIYNRALTATEIKENMGGNILAVDGSGKLVTTWSAIKKQIW